MCMCVGLQSHGQGEMGIIVNVRVGVALIRVGGA